ncbi:MAG: helix-turn-helix domain containing protein [Azoarcus sp.]|nr:helix-turn-helix domain containing protein [Azoarcus sp.]
MSKFLDGVHERLAFELERLKPQTVADATGISRATIYNWINRGNVPLDKLGLLENAGADVLYILTGERSGAASALAPDEAALLDNYRNSSPEAQDALKSTSLLLAQPRKAG